MLFKSATYHLLWICALSALLLACNKENAPDCFQKAGDIATEVRDLEAFGELELRDYMQFELVDSDVYRVEITAPQNLISDIVTDVQNGKLYIENANTCNFVRSYKNRMIVRIYAPSFANIQNHSTGDIRSVGILAGSVFKIENRKSAGRIDVQLDVDTAQIFTHTGVSDVYVKGHADHVFLFNQGLGLTDARALISSDANVNNSSINDVFVYSDGYLFGYIAFSGNIYYYGTPGLIDRVIDGDGEMKEGE